MATAASGLVVGQDQGTVQCSGVRGCIDESARLVHGAVKLIITIKVLDELARREKVLKGLGVHEKSGR